MGVSALATTHHHDQSESGKLKTELQDGQPSHSTITTDLI